MDTDRGRKSWGVLKFGIESLDSLFYEDKGILATSPTSLCILGPDGAGKSVLAMHLVTNYCRDTGGNAKILYASTDLSYGSALRTWTRFALVRPNESAKNGNRGQHGPQSREHCGLERSEPDNIADVLAEKAQRQVVHFINLQSATAGDDWGFLNRVAATLRIPKPGDPYHMLVVDAVEGLEIFVGERDAYGEPRSRRSRVAQLLRNVTDKAHVILIVEETSSSERLPEEFIADTVVRLRNVTQHGYTRRMLEIAKARGISHTRGQQIYVIRDGRGSITEGEYNPDDRYTPYDDDNKLYESLCACVRKSVTLLGPTKVPVRNKIPIHVKANIRVFPSIPHLARLTMEKKPDDRRNQLPETHDLGFAGIRELDELLTGWHDPTPIAIIGNHGTHKTELGRRFLAQCFRGHDETQFGIAVLLTNRKLSRDELIGDLAAIPADPRKRLRSDALKAEEVGERLLYRRLEVGSVSGPVLGHIVRSLIDEAENIQRGLKIKKRLIRFVLDDWAMIRAMYPDVADDDLILPHLLYCLREARVTPLFIATELSRPDIFVEPQEQQVFRTLFDQHVYTWHVDFFGQRRVAISAIPGEPGKQMLVRELWLNKENQLEVDPHFELYTGLAQGTPALTPLQIRLFSDNPLLPRYVERIDRLLSEALGRVSHGESMVVTEKPEDQEHLHELCYLLSDTHLNHTLVLQVDEYWAQSRAAGLHNLWEYMLSTTSVRNQPDKTTDPYGEFQPTRSDLDGARSGDKAGRKRADYFAFPRWPKPGDEDFSDKNDTVQFAPYTWDFGFLLLRQSAWREAMVEGNNAEKKSQRKQQDRASNKVETYADSGEERPQENVRNVWDNLTEPFSIDSKLVGWREFFRACVFVAKVRRLHGASSRVWPFDLGMVTPEAFSCLVLEIWASEIAKRSSTPPLAFEKAWTRRGAEEDRARNLKLGLLNWLAPRDGQIQDLDWCGYRLELYKTWMILCETLRDTEFAISRDGFTFEHRTLNLETVASRHWYTTAARAMAESDPKDPFFVARLPGHYSVRGDWSLAIARGSRSTRLGERTIDLLCSRRENVTRVLEGLGLPTRGLPGSPQPEGSSRRKKSGEGVPTALFKIDKSGRRRHLYYSELLEFGAGDKNPSPFSWLWRSDFAYYDRHARIWQRWLCETFQWLNQVRYERGGKWTSGFEVYEDLEKDRRKVLGNFESWREFPKRCDSLVASLKAATPRS